jgi:hypothetical protein
MPRTIEYPLYADKQKRRLPHSDVTAVTLYRSSDGTVREYDLFTDDDAYLGRCYYQPRDRWRSAAYTIDRVRMINSESWPNLTAFANEMKRRHGIEVK